MDLTNINPLIVTKMLPSIDRPLLVGLLVDVSASMVSPIYSSYEKSSNRLESVRNAFNGLVKQGQTMSIQEGIVDVVSPLVKIFAYGFGFGNPIAVLLGDKGPKVRDLLEITDAPSSTVGIDQLSKNWSHYQKHIEQLVAKMFGDTPMVDGFQTAMNRFRSEVGKMKYVAPPILFVLSDGEPTDGTPEKVIQIANAIKADGILIISCYITSEDITEPRHLYNSPMPNWPVGAQLMCTCASELPEDSPFALYLNEYGWKASSGVRLFAQINQSEILSEFLNLILSPLKQISEAKPSEVSTAKEVSHSIEVQISNLSRRLNKLREIEALKGIDTEPHYLLEIEDLQKKLDDLLEQRRNL